ncbi:MAG: zf-HC2 domain-containing protein [Chloroflexi bacterium]|nr:MAG: zf-HC2 domain-containing protein [Chloroflexota bacterium]
MTKHSRISCYQCQSQLSHYVHDELSPLQRRKVAQHLTSCADCDRIYRTEKQIAQQLGSEMLFVGRGHVPDFATIWASVEHEVFKPKSQPARYSVRHGLVAIVLMLALMLPLMWLGRGTSSVLVQQPVPVIEAATQMPLRTEAATDVALNINETVESIIVRRGLPDAVPVPSATQTP